MKGITSIVKKELRSYFNSPIAYLAALFFIILSNVSFFFIARFFISNTASLKAYFTFTPYIFSVLIPALTMRSWAEERKSGTQELLITLPISDRALVLGKYLASFILVCIMLVLTFTVPLCVTQFGNFDILQIIVQYLGLLFLGSACIAFGQFVSMNTQDQISAFIISTILMLLINFFPILNNFFALPKIIADLSNWLSFNFHFESFTKGVLDTRDIAYFVIISVLFIYGSEKTILFRKWR